MFDVDDLIDRCRQARAESEPRRASREVLDEVLARPAEVADVLRPSEGGLTLLHRSDDLTVVDVVWAPGMEIYPHDHRMWAVVGVYCGAEHNRFHRRVPGGLADAGGRMLTESRFWPRASDARWRSFGRSILFRFLFTSP